MNFDEKQIEDLKRIAPNLSKAEEGGYSFIFIEGLVLPPNCTPNKVDALLCPSPIGEGYQSRLYLSTKISGCPPRNWNGNIRLLSRNWHAISWQTLPNLTLSQMLLTHLKAFSV